MATKKANGQFYTTNCQYILEGMPIPPFDAERIVEPFAGQGDIIDWVRGLSCQVPIEAYDIDPKRDDIRQRDTLRDPPNYTNAWVITNPPYLARNKSDSKDIYDRYKTNDLYKCFLRTLCTTPCRGGIILIPAGFFFSPRELDTHCRNDFMTTYTLTKIKYFEEQVFDDTPTTIVAIAFVRSSTPQLSQHVEWTFLPSNTSCTFPMRSEHKWIVGGEIYSINPPPSIMIRRHVEGQPLKTDEQQTYMTLNALDSGTPDGRIKLTYIHGFVYPAKESSRTYATLRVRGVQLSEIEQQKLCERFNHYLEKKRTEIRSLFLPQYRESKEYARKRIPFELAYRIIAVLISSQEEH